MKPSNHNINCTSGKNMTTRSQIGLYVLAGLLVLGICVLSLCTYANIHKELTELRKAAVNSQKEMDNMKLRTSMEIGDLQAMCLNTTLKFNTMINQRIDRKNGYFDEDDGIIFRAKRQIPKCVCKGLKGEPGSPGRMGASGPRGMPGAKGSIGQVGDAGPRGASGAPGQQGIKGQKGDLGEPGVRGLTGSTGSTGRIGMEGLKGAKGQKGSQGLIGRPGATGQTGPKGEEGGIPGETGVTGENGDDGTLPTTGAGNAYDETTMAR